ncbi:MAG: hypothetical protein JWR15_2956 [Prosthecobacter sp.]|nr:hypothetical protein [Prosthecobacter sp.]
MRPPVATPVAASTAAILSLADLRRQHSALLQRQFAGPGTEKPSRDEILGFLSAAGELGRTLDDFDQRETAQSTMNYWIAALLSNEPQTSKGGFPFDLLPFDAESASGVAHAAAQGQKQAAAVAQQADSLVSGLGEDDRRCLRHLALRFLRLKENASIAYSVPLSADDESLQSAESKALLAKLLEAGVVKQRNADGADKQMLVLANDNLISNWAFLRDISMQRRAFREVARGWDNGGRNTEALLHGGSQLAQALDYQDLNPNERTFLDASRLATEKSRRTTIRRISVLLCLAVVAVIVLFCQNERLVATERDLVKKNTDLESARNEVLKRVRELEDAQSDLQQSLAIAETSNSRLLSLRTCLVKIN